MTLKLKEAIEKAKLLPEGKQDELQISCLRRWRLRGVSPGSKLAEMGKKAWADHQAGNTVAPGLLSAIFSH